MRSFTRWLLTALACCALAPGAAAAHRQPLEWNAFDVDAFLENDGALRIRERHTIVFTGDWNGAERVFGLQPGQSLRIQRVARLDPASGAVRPLAAGKLDQVDHYEYSSSNTTLRWRSRLPNDPAFSRTEISYVIDYVLYGVLTRSGNSLYIAHDFAFGRTAQIHEASVRLRAASGWWPEARLDRQFMRRNLPANEPLLVEASFAIPSRFELRRKWLLALLILVPVACLVMLLVYERRRGRLAPLDPVEQPELEQQLLRYKPELAAMSWHAWGGPSRSAVAALLARMVLEQKLSVRADQGPLVLELRIARDRLEGYERELVDGLFFDGDTCSAIALRSHYWSRGFSPRAYLAPLVAERDRIIGRGGLRGALLGLALALLGAGALCSLAAPGEAQLRTVVTCTLGLLPALVGSLVAAHWRSRLELNVHSVVDFVVPALIPPLGAALYVWLDGGLMVLADLGVALIALAYCAGVLAFAAGTETRDGLQQRRRLTANRVALARARHRRQALPEAILPYVIAFDLLGPTEASWPGQGWAGQLRSIASGVASPWVRSENPDAW